MALIYDLLLLFGLLFVAGLPLPLIPESIRATGFMRAATFGYMLSVTYGFYLWFWLHGGQTLGMRAWRIRLLQSDGAPLPLRIASMRFFAALLTNIIGFIWCLFDRNHRALYDIIAGTRVIRLQKNNHDA